MTSINLNTQLAHNIQGQYTNNVQESTAQNIQKNIGLNPNLTTNPLIHQQGITEVPTLTPPNVSLENAINITPPSIGAEMLSLIAQISSEQRQSNNEHRMIQSDATINQIKNQASDIRRQATAQLVTGILSSTLSIAQGIAKAVIQTKAMINIENSYNADGTLKEGITNMPATRAEAEKNLCAKIDIINTYTETANKVIDSVGNFIMTIGNKEIKDSEAETEKSRNMQETLKTFDEALKEIIERAISIQEAIQQNMNQTRTAILG